MFLLDYQQDKNENDHTNIDVEDMKDRDESKLEDTSDATEVDIYSDSEDAFVEIADRHATPEILTQTEVT